MAVEQQRRDQAVVFVQLSNKEAAIEKKLDDVDFMVTVHDGWVDGPEMVEDSTFRGSGAPQGHSSLCDWDVFFGSSPGKFKCSNFYKFEPLQSDPDHFTGRFTYYIKDNDNLEKTAYWKVSFEPVLKEPFEGPGGFYGPR